MIFLEEVFSTIDLRLGPIIAKAAIIISRANSTIVNIGSVMVKPPTDTVSPLMAGISNFLVKKTVMIEEAPNNKAVFTFTNPSLKLVTAPKRLVTPTTNNE